MNKVVAWLLGQPAETPVDPRLSDLDQKRDEADEDLIEAREHRATAERIGPELRSRIRRNHFGESIREALHQRGWSQS